MTEQVTKYMAQNARIFYVSLSDAVTESAMLNHLHGEDVSVLGRLEAFACCIAALQKDERASITARLSLPSIGVFSATAEKDGMIRGLKEGPAVGIEGTLEVSLQLHLRGNYTGMVCGSNTEELVCNYFSQSLQISAACRLFEKNGGFYCIVAEQLPGASCALSEICAEAGEKLPLEILPDGFEFLERTPLHFGCTCSRGALMRFVSSLPPEEREDLSENGKIVTHCNACGKKYVFEL